MRDNTKETFINAIGFQCLEHLQNNAVDIYLSTCGVQNCFPGHFYGPGQREEYIIHFICEGKGIYEVNGKTYSLSKGDFFVIPPKTEVYYRADDSCPWDYIWVGFDGIKATTYLKNAGIANEVGYSDPLTFTKMFKRIKGMSPSEWRHTQNH